MHEIGARARTDAAMRAVDAERHGGIGRGHGERLVARDADGVDHEADGGDHVEIGAGQRAVVKRQLAAAARDGAAAERDRRELGADRRHGIGDEIDARRPGLGTQRRRDGAGMDVEAVGDQAAPDIARIEHCADKARTAMAELAHGVEEMRREAGAGREGGAGDFVGRIAMADRDMDARRGEARDLRRRNGLGRDRRQHMLDAGRGQALEIALLHGADEVRIMGALARDREMRPLDMDAEAAGDVCGDGVANGRDRRRGHGGAVGDQRRQQRRGPEAGMGGADRTHALDGRRVIEQRAAAAIHLQVDEAGGDEAAIQHDPLGSLRKRSRRCGAGDCAAIDEHRDIAEAAHAVEDLGADIGLEAGHCAVPCCWCPVRRFPSPSSGGAAGRDCSRAPPKPPRRSDRRKGRSRSDR